MGWKVLLSYVIQNSPLSIIILLSQFGVNELLDYSPQITVQIFRTHGEADDISTCARVPDTLYYLSNYLYVFLQCLYYEKETNTSGILP